VASLDTAHPRVDTWLRGEARGGVAAYVGGLADGLTHPEIRWSPFLTTVQAHLRSMLLELTERVPADTGLGLVPLAVQSEFPAQSLHFLMSRSLPSSTVVAVEAPGSAP
jgi:hypothetical protein